MNHAHHVYRARRDALLKKMHEHAGGGLALVPTAPEIPRNRDSLFPFRHDSYFYYLSGFPEPEAVVALVAGPEGDRHVLFCRDKSEEREIWDGFRYGPDAAKEIYEKMITMFPGTMWSEKARLRYQGLSPQPFQRR